MGTPADPALASTQGRLPDAEIKHLAALHATSRIRPEDSDVALSILSLLTRTDHSGAIQLSGCFVILPMSPYDLREHHAVQPWPVPLQLLYMQVMSNVIMYEHRYSCIYDTHVYTYVYTVLALHQAVS